MNTQDYPKFCLEMTKLGAVYKENKPQEIIDLYFDGLKQFDFYIVATAFKKYIYGTEEENKFYPKPSQLIILCNEEIKAAKRELGFLKLKKEEKEEAEFDIIEISTNKICIGIALKKKPFQPNELMNNFINSQNGFYNFLKKFNNMNFDMVRLLVKNDLIEFDKQQKLLGENKRDAEIHSLR